MNKTSANLKHGTLQLGESREVERNDFDSLAFSQLHPDSRMQLRKASGTPKPNHATIVHIAEPRS